MTAVHLTCAITHALLPKHAGPLSTRRSAPQTVTEGVTSRPRRLATQYAPSTTLLEVLQKLQHSMPIVHPMISIRTAIVPCYPATHEDPILLLTAFLIGYGRCTYPVPG